VLLDDTRVFLEGLEPEARAQGAELYHASPRDPIWEYVISPDTALAALETTVAPVVLVGHSHVALSISLVDGSLEGSVAPDGTEADLDAARWLLNPGSVGQPRDGDPRASWLLLELQSWRATWRRTEYPVDEAADAIRAAGLPAQLADRLYYGQ